MECPVTQRQTTEPVILGYFWCPACQAMVPSNGKHPIINPDGPRTPWDDPCW